MSDVTRMWWSIGLTLGALAVVYAYTRWDLWRFRRKLAARRAEAKRLHELEMKRSGEEFIAWMDSFLAAELGDARSPR